MWFKLASATFSTHLGSMTDLSNSWNIIWSVSGGIVKTSCPGSVTKGGTLNATLTLNNGASLTSITSSSGTVTKTVSGTTVNVTVTGISANCTITVVATGGSTTTGTTYDVLLPITTTQGVYINSSLNITEMSAFNVAKAPVTPGMSITISARVGKAAAICWTDSAGKRTLLTMGNDGDGVNVNITETVPNGISYIECSYVNSSAFSLISQGNFVTVSTPTPVSTTTGKYINSTGLEAELSAMSYDEFAVSAGQYYYISNRNGTASAAVVWVNSDGSKTVALRGNANEGVNVNMVVAVPTDVSSMLVSYVNSQTHIVTLVKEA